MSNIGEIFAPLIPALVCGGLILGFRNVIGELPLFDGKTLTSISTFWNGLNSFLWVIGEAIFHMLPVGIVWSITRKMGTNQMLGIIVGLTLVSPQLFNAFVVVGMTPAELDKTAWDFGFFKVHKIGYQGQVISAILSGFVLVYLERFWNKVIPSILNLVLVPFLSVIPAVFIAHVFVGPIGWSIGQGLASFIYDSLMSPYGVIFAGVFGLLYAPIVITGLHHTTNAIDTQLFSTYGGTILWPMIALSNIAQGSAVLGMSMVQRHNPRAQQVNVPAFISCYLGVTEPALFGVNLKYGFPLICGMIGSSLAAMISVGFGVQAFSIGVGGLPGIISIKPEFWLYFLLAMATAIAVPFLLTFTVGKIKLSPAEKGVEEVKVDAPASAQDAAPIKTKSESADPAAPEQFVMPVTGKLVKLADIDDKAFSSGSIGEGFAVDLTDGKVYAPYSGKIIAAFPTKHAYAIETKEGAELLIHIGMDTVTLDGKGFKSYVKAGQEVNQGDLLAEVDLDFVRGKGLSLVTPVVFTNGETVIVNPRETVAAGDEGIVKIIQN